MSEPATILTNAVIKYDGSVRGPYDTGINVFVVRTSEGSFWFETKYEFAKNGADFFVIVWNFGLRSKEAAGSIDPGERRPFTASEAKAARARLESFFTGPRDNSSLPYLFQMARARCLGVKFPTDWITIAASR